eukprot:IDg8486t1
MDVESCRQSKGFDCIERERTDLVGRECTRRQAYSADTAGRYAIEGSTTMLEVAYAVASACPARSMKANIGRLEHRSATSGTLDLPEQADVPVESWLSLSEQADIVFKYPSSAYRNVWKYSH